MKNNVTKYIAIAILLVPMVSFAEPSESPSATPSTSESVSTATAATPSTSDSSSTATPATPSTSDSSSTATPATPSTSDSSSTATPATPSTGSSGSTAVNSSTPVNPPVNPSTSSGGPYSSSSGSRSYVYGCPMLTSYLKYGANNDTVQVAKLQNFLKNYEKMNVNVTGIFDKQTENAVSEFQTKYSNDIMGPWNKVSGTGYVYITTLKKINNIACNIPLTLNSTELSIINETVNKTEVANNVIVTPNSSNQVEIKGGNDNTKVMEIEIESSDTNVALVSEKTSTISKFWNFIKSLFQ